MFYFAGPGLVLDADPHVVSKWASGVLDRKADGDAPRWLETVGAYLTRPTKVDTLAAAMLADALAVPKET